MDQRAALNEDYILNCAECEYPFIKALENRIIKRMRNSVDFRLEVFEKEIFSKLENLNQPVNNEDADVSLDDSKNLSNTDGKSTSVIKFLLKSIPVVLMFLMFLMFIKSFQKQTECY